MKKQIALLLTILLGAGFLYLLAKYHCAPHVAKLRNAQAAGGATQTATVSPESLSHKPLADLKGKSYFDIRKDAETLELSGIVGTQAQYDMIVDHLANESTVVVKNGLKVSDKLPESLKGKAQQVVLASSLLNKAKFSLAENHAVLIGDVNTSVNKNVFEKNIRGILYPIPAQIDLAVSGLDDSGRACQSKLIRMLSTFSIQFEFASADISQDSLEALDKLTAVVSECGEQRFSISGHTDNTGSAEANLSLSQARANSIKEYLVSKGVETNRVNAIGYGETQPVDNNDTEAGRQNNRRIEITVLPQ